MTYRGGEKVLDAVLELFPTANIYTLFLDSRSLSDIVRRHPIKTSWLQRIPGITRHYRKLLPLMPLAIESLRLTDYDLVISTSHCVAKGILAPPSARHLCYCLTPARYAWSLTEEYLPHPLARAVFQPFLHRFRQWDFVAAQRVDQFAAISTSIEERIRRYYRRDSVVIHPFADLQRFQWIGGDRSDFYLVASALVPYKRVDLAIQACRALDRRLIIVGAGPEEKRLRTIADDGVEFAGSVNDETLRDLYSNARALLFPGEEDFGIVPVEAMACGTPVIAYGKGGALDTIVDNQTGLFFWEPTVEALVQAVSQFESQSGIFGRDMCRRQALRFSKEKFQSELTTFIGNAGFQTNSIEKSISRHEDLVQ